MVVGLVLAPHALHTQRLSPVPWMVPLTRYARYCFACCLAWRRTGVFDIFHAAPRPRRSGCSRW